jgi:F-box/leucine-rich repeat protein 14
MAAIARGCGLLQQICLKSCGRCITDEMIKALRPLFLTLTHLDLTGCDNIGILALRELSHFHRLSHLNLSGCTGVDDNGIFALCEGDFHPGIRNLYLDRCFHVTNLSLSWITDSLKDRTLRGSTEVTLETLSFKDTK